MSHRDYVMMAFDKFIEGKDLGGKKLLDVGCRGTALKKAFTERGFEWTGVDHSPTNPEVTNADMRDLPFTDGTYDVVFCCHALEHVETPIAALREMKRVMRDDGWIFIATPSPCKKQITDGDPDHIFVMTPMQMHKWFVYCEFPTGDVHLQTENIKLEQDYNVISVARKTIKHED